jgi:hypothetical protein
VVIECPALQNYSDVLVGRLEDFPVELEVHCLPNPIHQLGEVLAQHRGEDQTLIDILPLRREASDL